MLPHLASRIFDITGTGVDVTLTSLTLQNGRTTGDNENGGAVGVSKSAANAHAGAGYANVIQLVCSKSSSMRTWVTVPPPAPGSGGPAVEAFYKASTANAMTYTGPGGALTPTTTWTRTMKCLEPRRAGFTSIVDFTVSAGSNCGIGSLSVDDIRVTHDPACPE
mgnify:CR=1 FL=1